MSTHAPEMPIQVDDETGVWTTDALPMLYVCLLYTSPSPRDS